MNVNRKHRVEPPDLSQFHENWVRFPLEEAAKYAGRHVAWSPDGTHILAHGTSPEEVDQMLEAQGIPLSQVVHGYVDAL